MTRWGKYVHEDVSRLDTAVATPPLNISTLLRTSKSAASNPLRAQWGLEDAFIVGYSGNMGRAHRLDELIDAACALRLQPDLRFVLISDGAQRAALQGRVTVLGLKDVVFQPYQPRERLRESLSLPDIHIVSLDERLEGLIVPNKFVGVLAMGDLCYGSAPWTAKQPT
jgi:glycosyltransferase involved in cell wall biosynthesis